MTKEKVIESAWGKYWDIYKNHINDKGYIPSSMLIDEVFGDISMDFDHYHCRPISLINMESNNGWFSISTRPESTGDYFVQLNDDRVTILKYDARYDDFSNGGRRNYISKVKYWQPITLPAKTLYEY